MPSDNSWTLPSVPNSFSSHKTFKAFKIITLFLSHNIVEAYKNHFSVNSPGSTLLNSSLEVVCNLTRKSFLNFFSRNQLE